MQSNCISPKLLLRDSKIGTFAFTPEVTTGGKWTVRFFPPTYQRELTWSVSCAGSEKVLKKQTYVSPAKFLNRRVVRSWGKCDFPFIMGNRAVSGGGFYEAAFATAWNREGEAVWAYSQAQDSLTNEHNTIMMSEPAPDEWVFLSRHAQSSFVWMKKNGEILKSLNFKEHDLPASAQGFRFDRYNRQLQYFSFDCKPSRKNPSGPTYRSRKLVNLDLASLKAFVLWRTTDKFDVQEFPNTFLFPLINSDPYLTLTSPTLRAEQMRHKRVWYDWPDRMCHSEWSHENSVDYNPDWGYLISIRNLNKLVLFDPEKHRELVIGTKPGCNFCLDSEYTFSNQHAAQFIGSDRILLYDNHLPARGVGGSRTANQLMLLSLKKTPPQTVKIESAVPIPGIFSWERGYAGVLPSGDFFVYNPGNAGTVESYMQFSAKTLKPVCRTDFENLDGNRPIEARGFSSLIGESFTPSESTDPTPVPSWVDRFESSQQY